MGLFEAASGGSLFLDEIPSLSLTIQAKVLTALETGRIRRVGGNKEIEVDARLITATNIDLQQAIREGTFRRIFTIALIFYKSAFLLYAKDHKTSRG